MKRSTHFYSSAILAIYACGSIALFAQQSDATTTTVTGATGTISAVNYGSGREAQGFLVGTNILLSFPTNVCGGLGTLGAVGNSITYSGTASTATSGFESVRLTTFTNNTTKATYTAPTTNSTAYGPASGTVKQLNYAEGGSIDGFIFTTAASTTPIFVSTGNHASTTLTTLLVVGATVSVTGITSQNLSACSSTDSLEAVNASSLTIGSQTIVFNQGGPGGSYPGRPGGQN